MIAICTAHSCRNYDPEAYQHCKYDEIELDPMGGCLGYDGDEQYMVSAQDVIDWAKEENNDMQS